MPSECNFVLTKSPSLYYAGEEFVGARIVLKTSKDKNIDSVEVAFKGGCKVINSGLIQVPGGEINANQYASEVYDCQRKVVYDQKVLPAGQYQWNFRCKVSEDCLTSLEGEHGHIRYHLILTIKNTDKYHNIFSQPVTVIKPYDLNSSSCRHLGSWQKSTINANYNIGPDRFRLFCRLRALHSAYVAGQAMEYEFIVTDKTANHIISYVIEFIKYASYKADNPNTYTKEVETVLCSEEIRDNGLAFQGETGVIIIPFIPPTTDSKYINVNYVLSVRPIISISELNLSAFTPIIIGTAPIRRSILREQERLFEYDFNTSALIASIRPRFYKLALAPNPHFVDTQEPELGRNDNFLPTYFSHDVDD